MGLFRKNSEEQMVKRLAGNAGNITNMFYQMFSSPQGVDLTRVLIFAAGLAGHACHQAVKAEHGDFAVVKTTDGRTFYFGDSVNQYLFNSKTSVIGLCTAAVRFPGDDVLKIIADFSQSIGAKEQKICGLQPEYLYRQVSQCWEGIFHNMTDRYCNSPSEWPILFGIVLQNILIKAVQVGAPEEEAVRFAIEAAAAISKMDQDSF